MLGIRPRRQIGAAFANQFEHQRGPEPVNLREVDTKHRIQNRPCIKGGSMGRIVSVPRGGQSAVCCFRNSASKERPYGRCLKTSNGSA